MKTILLTGSTGFIGRNIQESYLNGKYALLCPTHKELDLCNQKSVREYFQHNQIDFVWHTAYSKNPLDTIRMYMNLEKEKGEITLFNFNSGAIYGNIPKLKIKEWYIGETIPEDDYGLSKYITYKQRGCTTINLILFGVFGKYERPTRLITSLIRQYKQGELPTINGIRYMSYLYVCDLVRILDALIINPPKYPTLNIVPDEFFSLNEIADIIIEEMHYPTEYTFYNIRLPDYVGDNILFKKDYPYFEFTPIRQAIKELIDGDI